MSAGDGRHKLGSRRERAAHARLLAAVRLSIEDYVVRRAQEDIARGLPESKRTVYKGELADALGITLRQLDNYAADTPIVAAKAVRLAELTGTPHLIHALAEETGHVAIEMPRFAALADPARLNAELFRNMEAFTRFHGLALEMARGGAVTVEQVRAAYPEGLASIRQILGLLAAFDLADNGRLDLPLLQRAMNRQEGPQG